MSVPENLSSEAICPSGDKKSIGFRPLTEISKFTYMDSLKGGRTWVVIVSLPLWDTVLLLHRRQWLQHYDDPRNVGHYCFKICLFPNGNQAISGLHCPVHNKPHQKSHLCLPCSGGCDSLSKPSRFLINSVGANLDEVVRAVFRNSERLKLNQDKWEFRKVSTWQTEACGERRA